MMLKTLSQIRLWLNFYGHHIQSYGAEIERHQLHFHNSKKLKNYHHQRVTRSFWSMIIPAILTFLFGVRALLYVIFSAHFDTAEKRMMIATEMFPSQGRRSYEWTMVLWSAVHVLYVAYVLGGRLVHFAFLANLAVRPDGRITPKNLDLREREYEEFDKFRHRALLARDFIIYGISANTIGLFVVVQDNVWNVLHRHPFLFPFWLIYFQVWTFYACGAEYGLPILISITAHYIQVKQHSSLHAMRRLNLWMRSHAKSSISRLRRISLYTQLLTINHRYAKVLCEIRHANHVIRRALNIILLVYIGIITYSTYLIFLTNTATEFKLFYSNIYCAHCGMLTWLIVRCSAITRFNAKMRLEAIRFGVHARRRELYGPGYFLKIDQIAENWRRKAGFCLSNSSIIDTNAYFAVFYGISSCFFLLFKEKKKFL